MPARPSPGRDQRVDFWRGLCLVGMICWHLLTDPSYPRWLAFAVIQPFNFVAEGFVLLAGTAVGLQLARARVPAHRFWKRAAWLLLVNYALIGFIVGLVLADQALGAPVLGLALPVSLIDVVTLQYQPYLADVLTVFVFLLALAPLVLIIYRTVGVTGLAAASAATYLTAPFFPINAAGAFTVNSWQIFFVAGFVLGIRYDAVIARLERPSGRVLGIALLAFLLLAAVRFTVGPDATGGAAWYSLLTFSRKPLTPGRVAYIGSQMLFIGLLTLRLWPVIARARVVEILALFGRHSLGVFIASVVMDYSLKFAMRRLAVTFPLNVLVLVGELLALYWLAQLLTRRSPRKRPAHPRPARSA